MAVNSAVDKYFEEVDKHKLLDAENELACAIAAKLGDRAARDAFILANLRLVVKIAHEIQADFFPVEDRISEGNIGLIEAVDRFEPERGLRFSTYAVYWIKHRIYLALCRMARAYRLPPAVYNRLAKYRRALDTLHARGVHDPTDKELSRVLGVAVGKVRLFRKLDGHTESSLNSHEAPFGDEGFDIIDENTPSPAVSAMRANTRDELEAVMILLSQKERIVVRMKHPLDDARPKKIDEIAQHIGCSDEKVRQLHKSGLAKLRKGLLDHRNIEHSHELLPH